MMKAATSPTANTLIVDSGASRNVVPARYLPILDNVRAVPQSKLVLANGESISSDRLGDLHFKLAEDETIYTLTDCLIVECDETFISVPQLTSKGFSFIFGKEQCQIHNGDELTMSIPKDGHLYCSTITPQEPPRHREQLHLMREVLEQLHLRFGHVNEQALRRMTTSYRVADIPKTEHLPPCTICATGKSKAATKNQHADNDNYKPLELIQSDLSGPHPRSHSGNEYFQIIVDKQSKYISIDLLKAKNEAPSNIIDFVEFMERQTTWNCKRIRTDGAAELNSKFFMDWCRDSRIIKETSAPYCQSQNGLAERNIQSINNMITCMLLQSGLTKTYWAEAAPYAAYVLNRIPRRDSTLCPYEIMFNRKPDLNLVHAFGCEAFAHIHKPKQKKFEAKAIRCIFLGIEDNHEAFRLLSIESKKIIISRDVKFNEKVFPFNANGKIFPIEVTVANPVVESVWTPITHHETTDDDTESEDNDDRPSSPIGKQESNGMPNSPNETTSQWGTQDLSSIANSASQPKRVSERTTKGQKTSSYHHHVMKQPPDTESEPQMPDIDEEFHYLYYASEEEPKSFNKAMQSQQKDKWMIALKEEFDANIRNNTWDYIPKQELPPGIAIHKPIWRFKVKSDGRYKARICFDGRHQKYNLDYFETYAPTPRLENIRMMLLVITAMKLQIQQGDVPSAFLNSKIDTDIFMHQPDGFVQDASKICKLNKGLYGLKQASRLWYEDINDYLTNVLKFTRFEHDNCIYAKNAGEPISIVILYVDDIIVASSDTTALEETMDQLHSKFLIKRMGSIAEYIGIQFDYDQDNATLTMNQSRAIMKILNKFEMNDCRPAAMPYNPDMNLPYENQNPDPHTLKKFRSMVGALLWIARCTRPDIMYDVNYLSQFQAVATDHHIGAAKHTLRYLAGTIGTCMTYKPNSSRPSIINTDSSFADTTIQLYSTTGYIVWIYGCPVLWRSKKQTQRVQSSKDAEYIAADSAIAEAMWFTSFVQEITQKTGAPIALPFRLDTDSQAIVQIIRKGTPAQGPARLMQLKHHLIIDRFNEGHFTIKWVRGEENPADILTKLIKSKALFIKHRDHILLNEPQP